LSSYYFGGDSGVGDGGLVFAGASVVVAGESGPSVLLRDHIATAITTTTIRAATAYQKRLSPKTSIATSRILLFPRASRGGAGEADTIDTYEKLTSAINRAKQEGDIELLREIASDPNGFILRQGWTRLDFSDANEIESLRKLLETLHAEIVNKLEALNNLHESSDYELYQLSSRQPGLLDEAGADLAKAISAEIAQLETEAEKLKSEIAELETDEALIV
jgi:hypothetical protein